MSLDRELYDESEETAEVPEEERSPSALDVYVFLWNRYRMIAKDFILQNYRSVPRENMVANHSLSSRSAGLGEGSTNIALSAMSAWRVGISCATTSSNGRRIT